MADRSGLVPAVWVLLMTSHPTTDERDIDALLNQPLAVLSSLLQTGASSAVQLTELVLERARATEPQIHAFVHLDEHDALVQAANADKMLRQGYALSPLHGIPVGVKDAFATKLIPSQAGSEVLRGHVPSSDAAVVARLRSAGAVIVGKQHMHEFGFGMNNPPTRGLRAPAAYPGGSTVGGAVSVAAGSCLAAIGTDGGGSIRKPASINGTVGYKPSFAVVSTEGILPGATSLDHVGWITRSAQDSALLHEVLTTQQTRTPTDMVGLRVGCPSYFYRDLSPDIERLIRSRLAQMCEAGAEVVEFDLPQLENASTIHATLGGFEAWKLHASSVQHAREQYDPATLQALLSWQSISPLEVARARQLRCDLQAAMRNAMLERNIDVLCTPTLALAPVPLDEMDPQIMLPQYCRLTLPFNVTGQPAISIPCGVDRESFPVGLQVAGLWGQDAKVLSFACLLEATSSS